MTENSYQCEFSSKYMLEKTTMQRIEETYMTKNSTQEESKGGEGEQDVLGKKEVKNGKDSEKGKKEDKLRRSMPARFFSKLDMCSKPCKGGYKKYNKRK